MCFPLEESLRQYPVRVRNMAKSPNVVPKEFVTQVKDGALASFPTLCSFFITFPLEIQKCVGSSSPYYVNVDWNLTKSIVKSSALHMMMKCLISTLMIDIM